MHIALRTDDILGGIFSHLRSSDIGEERGTSTLYHAALACKHFLPHALDALWYSMGNLDPLFDLLPSNSVSWEEPITLTELLSKDNLSIFDTYAHRIYEYHQDPDITSSIRTPVVLDLLECLDRRCLLPNLRSFKVDMDGSITDDTYCLFFCPTLEYVSIAFESSGDIWCFFPRLVRLAPSLRSFTTRYDISLPSDLLHLTRYLTKLRILDTNNDFHISINSFQSKFPFAAYLTDWCADSITLAKNDEATLDVYSCPDGPVVQFPALKRLELRALVYNAKGLADLFSISLFPNLQRLVLTACPHKDGNSNDTYASYKKGWTHFFRNIFSRTNHLESLKLLDGSTYTARPREDAGMRLSRLLEHAIQQQTLNSLSVAAPLLQSLTSTSVTSLAKIFPNLTHLSLLPKLATHSAMITLENLALLAQLLPKLSTLHICIDGTDSPSNPPIIPVLSHCLEKLALGKASKIGDPFPFARYISRIFPFVNIDTSHGPLPPKAEVVISALNMMIGWREDEYERRLQE